MVTGSDLSSAADNENESIVVDFLASPVSGEAPLIVQFTDTSIGVVTSRLWEFGNGSTSNAKNPSHIYSGTGMCTVTLTVNDGTIPVSVIKENYITVEEKPVAPVIVASFNSNVTSVKAPLTVRFEESSSGGPTA